MGKYMLYKRCTYVKANVRTSDCVQLFCTELHVHGTMTNISICTECIARFICVVKTMGGNSCRSAADQGKEFCILEAHHFTTELCMWRDRELRRKAVRHDGCTRVRRAVDSFVLFSDFLRHYYIRGEKWYVLSLLSDQQSFSLVGFHVQCVFWWQSRIYFLGLLRLACKEY